jgi:hypothetical protein
VTSVDELRYEVVFSAGEAAAGVHEVVWAANTWWPEKPASERLRLAEDAELLREWRTWAIPDGPRLYLSRTAAGDAWLDGLRRPPRRGGR